MELYTTLKQICAIPAVSGREGRLCALLKEKIEKNVSEVSVDTLGNLIALKKGSVGKRRVMLCAHMDEVGFLVNFIEDSGLIRVAPMGGIDLSAHAYTAVVSERGVRGVLAPNSDVKPSDMKADKMYIDIGASSKKEAERKVRLGDFFVGAPSLYKLSGRRIGGRPLDDRVGCLALLALAERLKDVELESDIYFVFSVQEEVGCRGSRTATYGIMPTEAICIDVTRTGDTPGATAMACSLGKGVAVKIKDSSVICHPEVVGELTAIAKAKGIAYQSEILTAGGTDASSMQLTAAGAAVGALSIPTRNIHTDAEICDMRDVEACIELAEAYIIKRG